MFRQDRLLGYSEWKQKKKKKLKVEHPSTTAAAKHKVANLENDVVFQISSRLNIAPPHNDIKKNFEPVWTIRKPGIFHTGAESFRRFSRFLISPWNPKRPAKISAKTAMEVSAIRNKLNVSFSSAKNFWTLIFIKRGSLKPWKSSTIKWINKKNDSGKNLFSFIDQFLQKTIKQR